VLNHLRSLYERRSEWALCCREELPVRGNNTNNLCESAMRVMKDKVLHRTKAFNVLQLIDFIVTRLEVHYQCRLVDVANNRLDVSRTSRVIASNSAIDITSIKKLENDTYEVPSEKSPEVTYTVNMSVGCCTCYVGHTGGPCKHQSAVVMAFKIQTWNFLPIADASMRQTFYIIATGDKTAPVEWFAPLSKGSDSSSMPVTQSQPTAVDANENGSVTVPMDCDPSSSDMTADIGIIDQLKMSFANIEELYRSDPVTYGPAIVSFCHQTEVATRSALQSALHCFGKYTGAAASLSCRRNLQSLKTIGVQPTALARRKMAVGGRRRCYLGRPPRSSYSHEHGYSLEHHGDKRHVLPRRRAPHNLATAVSNVEALGGTHSSK
jgi:hypothetical protein